MIFLYIGIIIIAICIGILINKTLKILEKNYNER